MTLSAAAIRKRAQRAHPTLTRCTLCGSTEHLHRHHPDYARPDEIVVVCIHCHAKLDLQDGTRRAKPAKVCMICGATFTEYSHPRVKTCSRRCLSEVGRRNAMKRWGGGMSNPTSHASLSESLSESTDLGASATPSFRRSANGSADASSNGKG